MKKNLGFVDRYVRGWFVFVVIMLAAGGIITGALLWVLGALAVVLAFTAATGFCPLYAMFHWSTWRAPRGEMPMQH